MYVAMGLNDFLKEVLFVIVLYNRRPEHSEAFASVCALRDILPPESVFIYDNSSERSVMDTGITYRHDDRNAGVSKAYNEASRSSIVKSWMLLLDQDTAFDENFLNKLYNARLSTPNSIAFVPVLKDSRGIVSPFRWSWGRGWRINRYSQQLRLEKYRFANSGLLIKTEAFKKVHGYDENVPLDYSDIAFGERLKQLTDYFTVVDVALAHDFSGSANLSRSGSLKRFKSHCHGGFAFGHLYGRQYQIYISILCRAISLSLRFRDPGFLRIVVAHLSKAPERR